MISSKRIWTFGGGKGGVGKSLVCSNVGLYLAQRGYRVLLLDGDFGAANLHTYLGMNMVGESLSDFLVTNKISIQDVIINTPYDKLALIPGVEDSLKISNLRYTQVRKLIDGLYKLDYDYILIDLGAGTALQAVDIFTEGAKQVLICMPEPAAIENTYRFIKYSFFRGIRKIILDKRVKVYLEELLMQNQTAGFLHPQQLLSAITAIDQTAGEQFRDFLASFNPKLVLNMVKSSSDIRLGVSMVNACRKYFGIKLDYIGYIEKDEYVSQLAKNRKPLLVDDPFAKASRGMRRIGDSLIG